MSNARHQMRFRSCVLAVSALVAGIAGCDAPMMPQAALIETQEISKSKEVVSVVRITLRNQHIRFADERPTYGLAEAIERLNHSIDNGVSCDGLLIVDTAANLDNAEIFDALTDWATAHRKRVFMKSVRGSIEAQAALGDVFEIDLE